ncbi:CDP-glycerol glycerophosphotransferase family protein [Pseudoalteromonas marina]|uniref:CDP-glycerol glycerophosphotransferase family protein n=1 Tax=Pseudoalteromonas marina TaxID=267375 RepID=A0ABT9FJL1_9GAMM|nr:CDP-glycerol glycerophosphotransferase family protein [Pseudoalteromonas marina]MDP2566849.1 CDP-glycerol glycerophosphotransferase family protein [Pseudoalteromonas marina]
MFVYFDVQHIYYLPQYIPVIEKLSNRGHQCALVFYRSQEKQFIDICETFAVEHSIKAIWLEDKSNTLDFYQGVECDWVVFGNAFLDVDKLNNKSVLMQHGIGPKSCYYDVSNTTTTVRFVEGEHRLKRLKNLYPNGNFVDSGYAKLDPIINNSVEKVDLARLGLDKNKPTLLYAPTFYPSSIECMSDDFPECFPDYNIIIKPHFFSLSKPRYKKQKSKIMRWQKYNNVYLTNESEFNLTPFLAVADIMLSDASSAIFEFAALDKPVVWCDFYKLRWNYRGIFSYRFKARLDEDINYFHKICQRAEQFSDVVSAVQLCASESEEFRFNRKKIIEQLAGKIDGNCADRIVNYLESYE